MRVECYAGLKADERPVRFWLDDREYEVKEITDQWYEPEDTFFKVRAGDGWYVLRVSRDGEWALSAFRRN